MAKQTVKPLAAAVGAAFLASVALAPAASALDNPFQADELNSGYSLDKHKEGNCGEDKDKGEEGKCGEGKCGEDKDKEGSCGEDKESE